MAKPQFVFDMYNDREPTLVPREIVARYLRNGRRNPRVTIKRLGKHWYQASIEWLDPTLTSIAYIYSITSH